MSDAPPTPAPTAPIDVAPVSESTEVSLEAAENPDTPAAAPPSKLEALPQRVLCAAVGVAFFVAFALPWVQVGETSLGRQSGLELAIDGFQAGSSQALISVVPLLGLALLSTAWWGRRRACMVGLIGAGLVILLGGAWQMLVYVAAAIGSGLWVVAGAGLVALLGGLPWRVIVERTRA